jgi:hypothetical protein
MKFLQGGGCENYFFGDVMPYTLVENYQHFGENCCLNLQGIKNHDLTDYIITS